MLPSVRSIFSHIEKVVSKVIKVGGAQQETKLSFCIIICCIVFSFVHRPATLFIITASSPLPNKLKY